MPFCFAAVLLWVGWSLFGRTWPGTGKGEEMKDKIFAVLQRVGRSFMLPIAVLPVAGLLLGI